jgi:hypothetical protein
MGTVIIGGGPRPRPTSNIYAISSVSDDGSSIASLCYEIRDGDEVIARCNMLSHAVALLPLIRSGE